MSKGKIVLVVDVSSGTLDQSVSVISQYVLQRLYNYPDNTIALILAGTNATDVSHINGKVDSFNNITVARPLLMGDKELIDMIHSLPQIHARNSVRISLVPALEVAMRLFDQEKAKTHWMSENRIMLFTDDAGLFDGDSNFVATEMNGIKPKIVFKLIGPNLEDTDTQNMPRNCRAMRSLRDKVEQGESLKMEEALQITSLYKTKTVRQTAAFKGCLEIGSGTKFPVHIINKVTPTSHQQSLKMCGSGGEAVTRDRVYHLKDENQTQIDPDCMNKGYRYGKTYIPISKVDASLMEGETEKELVLICTTKLSNIKKEELCGKYAYSVISHPSDVTGGTGLAAFATALQDLGMVAICRYVKKDDTTPKLCCLFPNVKSYCAALMMVELPFANDIKKAEFPRIRTVPSSEQLSAVDKLIDSMDLSSKPDFKVSEIANPTIQRRFECVAHRALHPDKPFPTVDIHHFFKTPTFEQSTDAVKECNKVFNITVLESKPTKRTAGDMFNTENMDINNEIKKVKKEDISFDDLLGTEIKIGTTTPLQDFQLACTKLGSQPACQLMCDVITQLVQHRGEHISDCLRSLRECCVKDSLFETFNEFLRGAFSNETVKRMCKDNVLTLIHRGECTKSPISEGEAEFFLNGDEIAAQMEGDEDDDLLDEL